MHRRAVIGLLASVVMSVSLQAGIAQTRPSDIQWTGKAGEQQVQIPAGEKATVMLFARADQAQSDEALKQMATLLKGTSVQALIVFSGPDAQQQVKQHAAELPFPAVADPDYSMSGKMGVHAWPTTVMLNGKGDTIAHIAGVAGNYPIEFSAYLDFLSGKIDRAAVDARMNDHSVITDDAKQAASRHLQMANRQLAKGRVDEAQAEIEKGLKLQADNGPLQLALVRVLVLKGNSEEAAKVLESVKPGSAPAPQMALARGRVLAATGKLDEAAAALQDAIKLNPDPSEAHYELGNVYQKQGQFEKAAAEFKAAYDSRI